jgi:CheY-like chemotaxis protein
MKNILIVDDDLDIHGLFKVEFKNSNYKLFFAKDDIEAIEFIKNEYISVIFLDIILGTNQTSKNVVSYSKGTPIFLMSSFITDEYKNSILKKDSAIIDCIKKPFKKTEMLEKVKALLISLNMKEELDESTLVNGNDEENLEESQVLKGSADTPDDSQLVKGTSEETEEDQVISGESEDLGEETSLVKGSPIEEDDHKETISGDKEDLGDESELVKGSKEEEDNHKEVISGDPVQAEEEVFVVKSSDSEDEGFSLNDLTLNETKKLSKEEEKFKNDIQFLTNKGPKSRTIDGYTRLMIATLLGQKLEVESALEDGEYIEDKCKGGYTSLHLSVLKNNLEVAAFLLEKGAKITAKDNENREPLFFAIQKGNVQMCELLIDKGAPLNRRVKGRTYLILSALKKNQNLFNLFKNKGISTEVRDDNGFNVKYYLKKFKIEHFL